MPSITLCPLLLWDCYTLFNESSLEYKLKLLSKGVERSSVHPQISTAQPKQYGRGTVITQRESDCAGRRNDRPVCYVVPAVAVCV